MPAEVVPPQNNHIRLSVCDVSKSFGGIRAVESVSFDVAVGEVVGIVGDNGAGKSTVVKMISGVYVPDTGSIFLDRGEITGLSPRAIRQRGVETIYQDMALAGNLDIAANIFLGREPARSRLLGTIDRETMARAATRTLSELGFDVSDTRKQVRNLSGGLQQGVAIARAVHWNARLLIMDEPTASLDMEGTRNLYSLIRELRRKGISIILISHNLQDIFELADRILVMRLGRMVGTLRVVDTDLGEVVRLIVGG